MSVKANVKSAVRSGRDHIRRPALFAMPPVPVPAAQVEAQKAASGPQPALSGAQPGFNPRETQPWQVLNEDEGMPQRVPQYTGGQAEPQEMDPAALRRLYDGLQGNGRRHHSFAADLKDLPFFGAVAAEMGWQGLHAPFRPPVHRRWSTDRWMDRAMTTIGMAAESAMAEVDAALAAAHTRVHAPHARALPPGGTS